MKFIFNTVSDTETVIPKYTFYISILTSFNIELMSRTSTFVNVTSECNLNSAEDNGYSLSTYK